MLRKIPLYIILLTLLHITVIAQDNPVKMTAEERKEAAKEKAKLREEERKQKEADKKAAEKAKEQAKKDKEKAKREAEKAKEKAKREAEKAKRQAEKDKKSGKTTPENAEKNELYVDDVAENKKEKATKKSRRSKPKADAQNTEGTIVKNNTKRPANGTKFFEVDGNVDKYLKGYANHYKQGVTINALGLYAKNIELGYERRVTRKQYATVSLGFGYGNNDLDKSSYNLLSFFVNNVASRYSIVRTALNVELGIMHPLNGVPIHDGYYIGPKFIYRAGTLSKYALGSRQTIEHQTQFAYLGGLIECARKLRLYGNVSTAIIVQAGYGTVVKNKLVQGNNYIEDGAEGVLFNIKYNVNYNFN